VIKEQITLKL